VNDQNPAAAASWVSEAAISTGIARGLAVIAATLGTAPARRDPDRASESFITPLMHLAA
jgi:hypothetical protein